MQKEHLEVILEDISGKFDLVLEGHAALGKKFDRKFDELNERIEINSFKIDTLNKKIDGFAAELKAHRTDTEAHHGVYRLKEG